MTAPRPSGGKIKISGGKFGTDPGFRPIFLEMKNSPARGGGAECSWKKQLLDFDSSADFGASFSLIFSHSSLEAPSLMVLGADSTKSLASFRPRPVSSRTTLMTLIFSEPASFRMASNSVFSSSAAAAPAAAPGTATTAAAAETPNFSSRAFTRSFSSRTVIFSISAINSS